MTRPPSPVMRRTVAGLIAVRRPLVGIVCCTRGGKHRAVIPVKGDVPTIRVRYHHRSQSATPPRRRRRWLALTDVASLRCAQTVRNRAAGPARVRRPGELFHNVGSRAFCQSTLVRKLNAEGLRRGLC